MTVKQIEELATNAVKRSLLPCDYLSPYINDNDKEPSWDGNVYLYSDPGQRKKDFIAKVPVQVKGELHKNLTQCQIKYDVDWYDLESYRRDGAMIFFVVYINPDDYSYKIYYASLTPTYIRGLLEECEYTQRTKRITLREFPEDSYEKTEIFERINNRDIALIEFFVQCFDRPAFRDSIYIEGSMDNFGQALEDTILALNTGLLRTRDGHKIMQEQGKSAVRNRVWRYELEDITEELIRMRNRLEDAKREGAYTEWGSGRYAGYYFPDRNLAKWFNERRMYILSRINWICGEAGIIPLQMDIRDTRW